MTYFVLQYHLDLIAFTVVSLCAMFSAHRWLRRRRQVAGIGRPAWLAILALVPMTLILAAAAGEWERSRLRKTLEGIAPTYALELERMGHARLPSDAGPDDPLYLELINAQIRWLTVNTTAADIYTFRKDAEGNVILIVDSETDYDRNGRYEGEREERTLIGEPYAEASEALQRTFDGAANFDDQPQHDRWGTWVSAYVPLRDAKGRVEGVLGVDYPAGHMLSSIIWHRGGPLSAGIVLVAILIATNSTTTLMRAEIARRHRAEAQLEQARQAAESANLAKSEFLANMSHEIRTPMTAILGYTDLLLEPDISADARCDRVNIIRANGEHLLSIINDILDISKIEAGKMTVERIPCAPAHLLHQIESLMRVRAAEKQIGLEVCLDGEIPAVIHSDPTRLRQILLNLAGNAIKFTPKGNVRITAGYDGANHRLVFEIADSGIGMTQQQIARLFKPFMQADSSTTRIFGGTGLGLVISHRLAKLLGGDIIVRSTPNVGSVFTVTIDPGALDNVPFIDSIDAATSAPQRPQPVEIAPAKIEARILLAEDTPANALLIAHYLRKAGAEVTIAQNGKIACDLELAALADGRGFDIILMDMQMPVLDGYAATARLRAAGCTAPIVALTAHAMSEDRDKCLRVGCTDFLSKPLTAGQLIESVARHIGAAPLNSDAAGGRDELDDFLPMFVATLPKAVREIRRCIECNDLQQLGVTIHRLKGSGGLYGFAEITRLAKQAEEALRSSSALESALITIHELIEVLRGVKGYDTSAEQPAAASASAA